MPEAPTARPYLHLGLRYIWIDDAKLFGSTIEVGTDVVLSTGLSFKF